MLDTAHAAEVQWKKSGGKVDRSARELKVAPELGNYTSAQDFELEWPDEGESVLTIVYQPDEKRSLSDPRYRVLEYDLQTGEHDVADRYPTGVTLFVFCIVGVFGGVVFLLLRLGARPLQKSTRWDWHMTAKKLDDEAATNELIARMRNRDA